MTVITTKMPATLLQFHSIRNGYTRKSYHHSLGCHGGQFLLQPGLDGLQVLNPLSGLSQQLLQLSYLSLELTLVLLQLLTALVG